MSTRRGSGATGKPPRQGGCLCFRPLQSIERETKLVYAWKVIKNVLAARSQAALCGRRTRGGPLLQGLPSLKTVHRTVFKFTPCGAPCGREFRRLRTATRGAPPPRPPQGSKAPLTPFRFAFGSFTLSSPPSNQSAVLHYVFQRRKYAVRVRTVNFHFFRFTFHPICDTIKR